MAAKTHYEVLGVAASASTDEIRRAYHKLARTHHPDRFREPAEKRRAEDLFTAMTDAFNVLTDHARRSDYDKSLQQSSSQPPGQREAKAYFRAGVAHLDAGNADDAVRAFKAAIHLHPEPGEHHARLAQALVATNAISEAARSWDEAIKREPYNGSYYRLAGQCLEKAGMATRARRMYEAALKWNQNDTQAQDGLSRLAKTENKTGLLGGLFKKA